MISHDADTLNAVELIARLEEMEAALDALHSRSADAIISPTGEIFGFNDADKPYLAFFNAMNEGGVTIDSSGFILHGNPCFVTMLGWPIDALRTKPFISCVAPKDRGKVEGLMASVVPSACDVMLDAKEGLLPVRLSFTPISEARLQFHCVVVTDLSERTKIAAELQIAAIAFESNEKKIVTDDQGIILRINQAFIRSTGYTTAEAVGQKPSLLKSGRHDDEFYQNMWDSLLTHKYWEGEIWDRYKDGGLHAEWVTISAVCAPDGKPIYFVGSYSEITKEKQAEAAIHQLSYYDVLTHLPNWRLLIDRLKQAQAASDRNRTEGALLFIDLDNFKILNETRGHHVGDLLLKEVAQRLAGCVREGDTVARVGGDEFVVMLEDLSPNLEEAAAQTKTVGEKIMAELNQPYMLAGQEHHNTPSIGVALFCDNKQSNDELLKRADMAMYKAKMEGHNTMRFFDPQMQAVVAARAALESDLRDGLKNNQFILHYQPQVDRQHGLTGAEVLVRWRHPVRGMVSPNEFIPLAEETGLILQLGTWVLETACAQLVAWASQPVAEHLILAVNVSARQFRQDDFVEQVLAVVKRTGVDPRKLKLELTESMLVKNVQDVIAKMTELRASGLVFSLDDFGTGYSSLSYLKRLPLSQLKIDQSFVRDVLTDPNEEAIVRTIIALGQSLGLSVIAEGVESEPQRELLARLGCKSYQGYLFSRPIPVEEFDLLLNRGRYGE